MVIGRLRWPWCRRGEWFCSNEFGGLSVETLISHLVWLRPAGLHCRLGLGGLKVRPLCQMADLRTVGGYPEQRSVWIAAVNLGIRWIWIGS